MKKQIGLTLAICTLLVGCVTSPETGKTIPDIPRIAAITREAAAIGTKEALIRQPQWTGKFVLVVAQLEVLEKQANITVEGMLYIISQLPVNELKSDNARLAISTARLVVAAAGWSQVEIVKSEQLRPVVKALREGLIAGGAVASDSPPLVP